MLNIGVRVNWNWRCGRSCAVCDYGAKKLYGRGDYNAAVPRDSYGRMKTSAPARMNSAPDT